MLVQQNEPIQIETGPTFLAILAPGGTPGRGQSHIAVVQRAVIHTGQTLGPLHTSIRSGLEPV